MSAMVGAPAVDKNLLHVARPKTRDRSISMPEFASNRDRISASTSDTDLAVKAQDSVEEIYAGPSIQPSLSETSKRPLGLNIDIAHASVVGKIHDSLQINKDGISDSEKLRRKWYHFTLKAAGERMLANRFSLSFINSLIENRYMEERFDRLVMQIKIMSAVLIGLVLLYGIADYLYNRPYYLILFTVRYGIAVPLMGLILAMMFTSIFPKFPQLMLVIYCFIMGVQFSVCAIVSGHFELFYYQSVLWPISFAFLFLGVQTLYALLLSVMLVGTMFFGFSAATAVEVLYNNQMLFQIVYFSFYAYIFEMKMRREFLLRRVVDRERSLLKREKETSEEVLLNILPKPIADRIKRQEQVADRFPKCTVIFIKVMSINRLDGSRKKDNQSPREPATLLSVTSVNPVEVFSTLNEIFSILDNRVGLFGLEKIKTIGQTYMAVGGVPIPTESHCEQVADFALDVKEVIKQYNRKHKSTVSLRIGIHTGPVVAGVIGNLKMIYDLWGDTCNVASRMESNSMPDCIQVTENVRDALKDKFVFESRGIFSIKGKGRMSTYFLQGKAKTNRVDFKKITEKKAARHSQLIETEYIPTDKHGDADFLKAFVSGTKFVNKFTLSFVDPKKEPKFMHVYAANSKVTVRFGLILVLFFHIISTFAEVPLLNSKLLDVYFVFKTIAVAIYIALILILWRGTFMYLKYMQLYALISAAVFFIYHLLAGAFISAVMYWGISSAYFFLFLFTKLRFVYALPLGVLFFGLFKLITNLPGTNTFDAEHNVVATCLFAALVVALSATHYLSEYLERRDFFMNVQLDKQRNKIEEEKEKADQLLLNILPKSVINNLKHKRAEPEYFSEVTVLFADIVGFTDFCSHKTPAEVVLVLSGLFLKFDELVHRHNVEKIKTVGDAYIVAAGVPIPCKDHAEQVVSYAIDMLTAVKAYNTANHRDLKIRIGIHTGPCVAGLLGIKRFTYDLIGEAIAVAAHAESNGSPNRIHITEECKEKLSRDRFIFEERSEVMDAKRKGTYKTYHS